jgi:hypothetical protein
MGERTDAPEVEGGLFIGRGWQHAKRALDLARPQVRGRARVPDGRTSYWWTHPERAVVYRPIGKKQERSHSSLRRRISL